MALIHWHSAAHDSFWQRLRSAPRAVLFLDYDGTLAPFVTDRDCAVPYDGVRERLEVLLSQSESSVKKTRIVFVTGRSASELPQLLGLSRPVEIWGGHGAEHLSLDGQLTFTSLSPHIASLLDSAYSIGLEYAEPTQMEKKRQSVAFHVRGLEPIDAVATLEAVWDGWERLIEEEKPNDGLHSGADVLSLDDMLSVVAPSCSIHEFHGGIEMRVEGHTKATAVCSVIEQEKHDIVCAFLGDDRTDEDGFEALLAAGPDGLPVLVSKVPRTTAARWILSPPEELLEFLDSWILARKS